MSRVRGLAAACVSALAAFFVAHASGCGTDAVGVDDCRDIEYARCEAAKHCGLVEDVAACKRFYRDQCLHGMTSGERPGGPRIKDCVTTIKNAGKCAQAGIEELAACPLDEDNNPVSVATNHTEPCQVVREPEGVRECEFLFKEVVVVEAGPDSEAGDDAADSGAVDASAE